MNNSFDNAPSAFICPITLTIMKNPVSDSDGNTFEEEAILQWIDLHHNSPITRNPMTRNSIKPNRALKDLIEAYLLNPHGNLLSQNQSQSLNNVNTEVIPQLERDPINIIMIADVSGSMETVASNNNSAEQINFTSLDLVKHTMNTIVESLTVHDTIGVVKFNNLATQVTDMLKVDTKNKSLLKGKISDLNASGGTNIWDALRVSIEMAKNYKGHGKIHLLLFTDGESNADPPRGIIPTLSDFLAKDPYTQLNITINTYGFGTNINSDLLYKISELKNGIFGFIPDSTMIGTVFVNSVAHLMTQNEHIQLPPAEETVRIELVDKLKKGKLGEFNTFIQQYRGIPFIDDIYIDCIDSTNDSDGQIFKAFEQRYYLKWGKHYINSVISAYNNKFCLNFKDHGIQHFKTHSFDKYQKSIEEVFVNLPPPIPSGRSYNGHVNAPVSVQTFSTSFYNQSGGCFLHDTLVKLYHGGVIPVQNITKGTLLSSDGKVSTVVCVVKIKFSGIVRQFKDYNTTSLTPYHPVYFEENKWVFPHDSDKFNDVQVNDVYVYDFVLDSNHIIELSGGIKAVTFGHGIEGNVVSHQYFGTDLILNDLVKHEGWNNGLIQLDENEYKFIRDEKTNLVVGLQF